jgi:hypothetical protein
MDKPKFSLAEFNLEARMTRLSKEQEKAFEEILKLCLNPESTLGKLHLKREAWLEFFLPLAEFGLSSDQMLGLAMRVPEGFPYDHRQIYYDFRLGNWIKHIEPPTISEILEEYLENSESTVQGMVYLKGQWRAFLDRHGRH